MTIRAYREIYLDRVMKSLGDAFDYAVNDCKIDGDTFTKIFMSCNVARRIENGEPAFIAGKSGIEIARECILETMGKQIKTEPIEKLDRSPEYWCGWAVAYYQWYSSRRFTEIFGTITFDDLLCMYPTLHEADITKFADVIDKRIKEARSETNLKRIRSTYGITQKELSELSGVSLRAIQMYEQRQKDINRASANSVLSMARVLGCTVEDLIEK